ncbi:hypothetical protein TVAG_369310 [Trichomonas vaginalis G3]|uniref:Leucine Rich Repeat family protein n=1 Tax=Trichomonas vaginalis (strain ATCC PRA-98 / G3) TaxID=412133 RepID=A2FGF7_TRIV3|nr:barbed-end actin filament uncapping [Trichomonas vaginalis G3]EAX96021.1 hypothetical protein TVAG_369310 [Trichomonas vaginalis G3]KAI5537100.1 barbed-end actin filament uncapping [Trichomonas vaginalis G3]|eukprot:XP_001308951.1 hypothetical protein [Trichomonas vaginalis G3]
MDSSDYLDSDLTEDEVKKVRLQVPLTQFQVFEIEKCSATFNKSTYNYAVCALSEHLLVFLKKGFGASFSVIVQYHILNIRSLHVEDENNVKLTVGNTKICLRGPKMIQFTRILLRNYILLTRLWPASMCLDFKPDKPKNFPAFTPHISLSEMFQLTYNAYCAYFNVDYYHDIARFFHTLVSTGNAIANFSNLPLSVVDTNFQDPVSLRPVIASFMFCPMIYGYLLTEVSRPDFLKSIAPLVKNNLKAKFIQCRACSVREGISDIADAVISNKQSNIIFYDLSKNPIIGISKFAYALSKVEHKILYINVSDTNLKTHDGIYFMKAFNNNPYLMSVMYFYMRGAPIGYAAIDQFCQFLELCSKHNKSNLRHLDVGTIYEGSEVFFGCLKANPMPLQYLAITDSTIKGKGYSKFILYLETTSFLEELDISGIGFTIEQIIEILQTIVKNDTIMKMKIHMNRIPSIGKGFSYIADFFNKPSNCDKFEGISMNQCSIDAKLITKFDQLFKNFKNLKELNIGGNFSKSNRELENVIDLLMSLEPVVHLGLEGNSKYYLGEKGCSYLCHQLKRNQHIREIDISNNRIGDEGLKAISSLLESNEKITVLKCDGSLPKTLESITMLFSIVGSHPSLYDFPWPYNDVYNFIENYASSKQRDITLETLSSKQKAAAENMQKNLNKAGMHSSLSLLRIPEIDRCIDECTLTFHELVSTQPVNTHSKIVRDFGLNYPHIDENCMYKGKKATLPKQPKCYDASSDSTGFTENNLDLAHTSQLEALAIRRPDLDERIKQLKKSIDGEEEGEQVEKMQTLDLINSEQPQGALVQDANKPKEDEESSDSSERSTSTSTTSNRNVNISIPVDSTPTPTSFQIEQPPPQIQAIPPVRFQADEQVRAPSPSGPILLSLPLPPPQINLQQRAVPPPVPLGTSLPASAAAAPAPLPPPPMPNQDNFNSLILPPGVQTVPPVKPAPLSSLEIVESMKPDQPHDMPAINGPLPPPQSNDEMGSLRSVNIPPPGPMSRPLSTGLPPMPPPIMPGSIPELNSGNLPPPPLPGQSTPKPFTPSLGTSLPNVPQAPAPLPPIPNQSQGFTPSLGTSLPNVPQAPAPLPPIPQQQNNKPDDSSDSDISSTSSVTSIPTDSESDSSDSSYSSSKSSKPAAKPPPSPKPVPAPVPAPAPKPAPAPEKPKPKPRRSDSSSS